MTGHEGQRIKADPIPRAASGKSIRRKAEAGPNIKTEANMKQRICFLLALLLLASALVCTSCSGRERRHEYSGHYRHKWSGMVMYHFEAGDGRERDQAFYLDEDGGGTYREGSTKHSISWDVDTDGSVTIEVKSLLFSKTFRGSFEGGSLHLWDGDPEDNWTVEYMFEYAGQ